MGQRFALTQGHIGFPLALRWGVAALAATVSGAAVLGAGACVPDASDTSTGGAGGFNLMPDAGDGSFDPDAACAKFEEQAISKPVNLYVMFDKSSSMAGNKWDSAEAGLGAFVDDETSAGLSVALRFFPREADSVPVCDQQGYKEPTVAFGLLPDNATALKAAIAAETANGFSTPMYPALGGGILKGIEMAENHPGELSALLMVTDGQPEGPAPLCGGVDPEDPAEIAALAATGANFDPPVATYVVGLPGVDQATANQIAAAGGTESAILVGANNVEEEFREALAKVRGDALPCVYEIPDQVLDGEVTIAQVNIEVWPGDGGAPYIVPQNQSCDGDGWHYDDPETPSEIILCPDTCAALKSDMGAAIRILLGCATALK